MGLRLGYVGVIRVGMGLGWLGLGLGPYANPNPNLDERVEYSFVRRAVGVQVAQQLAQLIALEGAIVVCVELAEPRVEPVGGGDESEDTHKSSR